MTPIRVLGACGLFAAGLTCLAPVSSAFVSMAGFVMVFGNLYALLWGAK